MKKIDLIIVIVLQVMKIPVTICKGILFVLYLAVSYIRYIMERIQRKLYVKIYRYGKLEKSGNTKSKKKDKLSAEKAKPVRINTVVEENAELVGKTRTEFITELPRLKSNEPFLSEPLEKEIVNEYEEEPDIDPGDIEVEDTQRSMRDILAEEEPEMFSHDADMPSDVSSGVTIEQLTETYDILSKDNPTPHQEAEAADILEAVEGTAFLQFFLLQKECAIKAKELMDKRSNDNNIENNFNMDMYL